ncbi:MAG: hypothetical protein HQL37_02810 [Alphaproteobacteria bacterium]|nr:hypothetical protein [Alphaproteobacteria bacterium]
MTNEALPISWWRSLLSPHGMFFVVGAFFIIVLGMLIGEAWKAGEGASTVGATMANHYAGVFIDHTTRSLAAADAAVQQVAARLAYDPVWAEGDKEKLSVLLREAILGQNPELHEIILFDKNGIAVATSGHELKIPTEAACRRRYLRHRDNRDELVVGRPIFGFVSGRWTFGLSRTIHDEHGGFNGMAIAEIDLKSFEEFYRSSIMLPGVDVAMVNSRNQSVLAYWPSVVSDDCIAYTNQPFASIPVFALVASSNLRGVLITKKTTYAVKDLDGFPVHIAVAVSSRDISDHWSRHVRDMILAAVIMLALWGLSVGMVQRHWRGEKLANHALRLAVDKFSALATCSAEWFWEADGNGALVDLNQGGDAAASTSEGAFSDLQAWMANDSGRMEGVGKLKAAMATRLPFRNVEWRFDRADGTVGWMRWNGVPYLGEDGRFLGFRGTASDITAERDMATRQAQHQRVEALGQLASGIAHELNNLLHPMISFAHFAKKRISNDEKAVEYLNNVYENGILAREIVRGVLTFARHDTLGHVAVVFRQAVVRGLELAVSALPSSMKVVTDLHDLPHLALVNETEVAQVVVNLLTNARDATQGTGTVNVTLREVELNDGEVGGRALTAGRYHALVIQDNGCGMDEITRMKIFDPFFTTKAPGEGTGLGLSVVYGIIASWQGAITVDTKPGGGTAFTIYVPVLGV